jgi:hypothetical protein
LNIKAGELGMDRSILDLEFNGKVLEVLKACAETTFFFDLMEKLLRAKGREPAFRSAWLLQAFESHSYIKGEEPP